MTNQFLQFEKLEACPGCGSNDRLTIVEREITQCDACQLYFRNPRPAQEEIARSYDTGGTFEAWQDEEPARARMWERRLKILQRYVSGGQLLDVGTGDGRFLATAKKAGYTVTGTEVSRAGASYAQERGFNVQLGQITDLTLPPASFDAATIWHVLEHVPNPQAVLQKVQVPGADFEIVLAVPKYPAAVIHDLGKSPDALLLHLVGGALVLGFDAPEKMIAALESVRSPACAFHVDGKGDKRPAPIAVFVVPKAE